MSNTNARNRKTKDVNNIFAINNFMIYDYNYLRKDTNRMGLVNSI